MRGENTGEDPRIGVGKANGVARAAPRAILAKGRLTGGPATVILFGKLEQFEI
jgi:hypothetical protein